MRNVAFRLTPVRQAVWHALGADTEMHVTAEHLYLRLMQSGTPFNTSSIAKALLDLQRAGWVERKPIGRRAGYRAVLPMERPLQVHLVHGGRHVRIDDAPLLRQLRRVLERELPELSDALPRGLRIDLIVPPHKALGDLFEP